MRTGRTDTNKGESAEEFLLTREAVVRFVQDSIVWRSGDRKIADTIPLTHGAQTTDYGGGTPIRVICKSLASPCVPVGRAGCTLLR